MIIDAVVKADKFLRARDIPEIFNLGSTGANKRLAEFEYETNRIDSKIPHMAYIKAAGAVLVHYLAFWYFLKYREILLDETARKRLEPFNVKVFKDLIVDEKIK